MPTANLTDRKVASLKAGDPEEWWDEKVPGFGIRVSSKGKKTWFVMYRYAGLRRRLKLGHYPDVDLEGGPEEGAQCPEKGRRRQRPGAAEKGQTRRSSARKTRSQDIRSTGGSLHRTIRKTEQEELAGGRPHSR
jgi:hypothetical protein